MDGVAKKVLFLREIRRHRTSARYGVNHGPRTRCRGCLISGPRSRPAGCRWTRSSSSVARHPGDRAGIDRVGPAGHGHGRAVPGRPRQSTRFGRRRRGRPQSLPALLVVRRRQAPRPRGLPAHGSGGRGRRGPRSFGRAPARHRRRRRLRGTRTVADEDALDTRRADALVALGPTAIANDQDPGRATGGRSHRSRRPYWGTGLEVRSRAGR